MILYSIFHITKAKQKEKILTKQMGHISGTLRWWYQMLIPTQARRQEKLTIQACSVLILSNKATFPKKHLLPGAHSWSLLLLLRGHPTHQGNRFLPNSHSCLGQLGHTGWWIPALAAMTKHPLDDREPTLWFPCLTQWPSPFHANLWEKGG